MTKQQLEERNAELVRIVDKLQASLDKAYEEHRALHDFILDDLGSFNDGCGCCGSTDARSAYALWREERSRKAATND